MKTETTLEINRNTYKSILTNDKGIIKLNGKSIAQFNFDDDGEIINAKILNVLDVVNALDLIINKKGE